MGRSAAGVVGLALCSALCGGCGGGNQSTVPSHVRAAIVRDFPGWAFVPGRLPSGYHYANWIGCRNGSCYSIGFLRGSRKSTGAVGLGSTGLKNGDSLSMQVVRRSCQAPPKGRAEGTLHVDGHLLTWAQTDVGTLVWRCLTIHGRSFEIFSVGGSRRKLAELVGYAVPAH